MKFLAYFLISVTAAHSAHIDHLEYHAPSQSIRLTVEFCRKTDDVWPIISYISDPCDTEPESPATPQCHITVMVHNETMDCEETGVIVEHKPAIYRVSTDTPRPSTLIFKTSDGSSRTFSLN